MKAYLNKEKIIAWYMKNNPEEFLLAKLNDGQKINEDTRYDASWMEEYDGFEVIPDKNDKRILKLVHEDNNNELYVHQPEEDAWIEWK